MAAPEARDVYLCVSRYSVRATLPAIRNTGAALSNGAEKACTFAYCQLSTSLLVA